MQLTFVKVFGRTQRVLFRESFPYLESRIFGDCLFRDTRANGCEISATKSRAAVNLHRQIRRDETVKNLPILCSSLSIPNLYALRPSSRFSSVLTLELFARRRASLLLRRACSAVEVVPSSPRSSSVVLDTRI